MCDPGVRFDTIYTPAIHLLKIAGKKKKKRMNVQSRDDASYINTHTQGKKKRQTHRLVYFSYTIFVFFFL